MKPEKWFSEREIFRRNIIDFVQMASPFGCVFYWKCSQDNEEGCLLFLISTDLLSSTVLSNI